MGLKEHLFVVYKSCSHSYKVRDKETDETNE